MDAHNEIIAGLAGRLAAELPLPSLRIVIQIIEDSPSLVAAKTRMAELPQPYHRQLAVGFVNDCMAAMPRVLPGTVALILLASGVSEQVHRTIQSAELVWTGPDTGAVPFRRTEQAILQVLDSACHRVTLASYAVYRIPNIREALVRAARRGVQTRIIIETPDRIEGQQEYSTLQALGPEVSACSTVYYWPRAKRNCCGDKIGILHVKCAVADERWLFLSSANLTQYAFSINMELGMLVTGGSLPRQVEENFRRLIAGGILEGI